MTGLHESCSAEANIPKFRHFSVIIKIAFLNSDSWYKTTDCHQRNQRLDKTAASIIWNNGMNDSCSHCDLKQFTCEMLSWKLSALKCFKPSNLNNKEYWVVTRILICGRTPAWWRNAQLSRWIQSPGRYYWTSKAGIIQAIIKYPAVTAPTF
jgi:hypothetical protein